MPASPDEIAAVTAALESLTRVPDVEGPGLTAVDGADRLLLAEAFDDLRSSAPTDVVVIDDRYGALTIGSSMLGSYTLEPHTSTSPPPIVAPGAPLPGLRVRVHQDWLVSQRALETNVDRLDLTGAVVGHPAIDASLLGSARVVLLRLPKSLDALREQAAAIARYIPDDAVVYSGGPVKHMTRSMNAVLAEYFGQVHASLGRYKARVLIARDPLCAARTRAPEFPRSARIDELDMTVVAHGGVFAGTRLDIGTRFLLSFLPQMAPSASTAVDVGCGSGIVATRLAMTRPGIDVIASDQSAAAADSARATAQANGVGHTVTAMRDDALSGLADASADLLVCNPPFHAGTTLHTDAAQRMFDAAGRVLRPGGELWTVYNSHLRHRRDLSRAVGPTTMMSQSPKFTVTKSVRRS
jgi:16S rRNA (guanine1207-N2)-methyltransferase